MTFNIRCRIIGIIMNITKAKNGLINKDEKTNY